MCTDSEKRCDGVRRNLKYVLDNSTHYDHCFDGDIYDFLEQTNDAGVRRDEKSTGSG